MQIQIDDIAASAEREGLFEGVSRLLVGCSGGGDSTAKSRDTFAVRFWQKVNVTGECWEWTGAKNAEGYGQIRLGPRGSTPLKAHRAVLILLGFDIPEYIVVHHRCGNRSCVKPLHLDGMLATDHAAAYNRFGWLAGQQLTFADVLKQ